MIFIATYFACAIMQDDIMHCTSARSAGHFLTEESCTADEPNAAGQVARSALANGAKEMLYFHFYCHGVDAGDSLL